MSIKNNVDTINAILERAVERRQFHSDRERITYELGYIIGLLAKLMENDTLIKSAVRSIHKDK